MSSLATVTSEDTRLQYLVGELRDHFRAYFDTGWFAVLLEGSPIHFTVIREIRNSLDRDGLFPDDRPALRYGVSVLRQFTEQLRRYLLPYLRERLGISGLLAHKPRLSAEEYVYRRLVAYTFPANLARLEELTDRVSEALES